MNRVGKILLCVLLGILFVIAVVYGTQLLWNWLVPVLFNGPVISFWQTLGLLVLSKILFSGFGKGHHGGHSKPYWKNRLHKKFSSMTTEEREAFKQKMRDKWCIYSPESKDDKDSID